MPTTTGTPVVVPLAVIRRAIQLQAMITLPAMSRMLQTKSTLVSVSVVPRVPRRRVPTAAAIIAVIPADAICLTTKNTATTLKQLF